MSRLVEDEEEGDIMNSSTSEARFAESLNGRYPQASLLVSRIPHTAAVHGVLEGGAAGLGDVRRSHEGFVISSPAAFALSCGSLHVGPICSHRSKRCHEHLHAVGLFSLTPCDFE